MKFLSILLLIVISSCKHNEFDAPYYAKKYCICMEKNKRIYDVFQAQAICDADLQKSNKYFRTFYIEDNYGRYMMFLPQGFKDSVVRFRYEFLNHLEMKCCKEAVLNCDESDSLQIKRNAIDKMK